MQIDHLKRDADQVVPHLMAWLVDGKLAKGTLEAVVRNDLTSALVRSSERARWLLPAITDWFANVAPAECWGDEAKVERWATTYGAVPTDPVGEDEHPNMRRKRVLAAMPLSVEQMKEELVKRLTDRLVDWAGAAATA